MSSIIYRYPSVKGQGGGSHDSSASAFIIVLFTTLSIQAASMYGKH